MFFSRAQWGARAPESGMKRVPLGDRDAFVVHYSTGEELGREDCAAWVREIQRFHQGPQRGWSDVGYNFLVCRHGDVFEGRGWDYAGAHAPEWNVRALGVCFLGDDDPGQDVPEVARQAIRGLWEEGERRCGPLRRLGHRDTQRKGYTSCPGDELAAWVAAGMPVLGTGPVTQGSPPYPGRALRDRTDHPAARSWQQRMRARGWRIKVDGVYGAKSAEACRKFQAEKGLVADGVVGPVTWAATWTAPVT